MQSLSTRILRSFGTAFVIALAAMLTLWYAGLPTLGFEGAGSQRLAEATRALELEADHMADWFNQGMQERRGDMTNLAENITLARLLAAPASEALQRNTERIHERMLRAFPDSYHAFFILSPETGQILAASDPQQVGQPFPDQALAQSAARPGTSELVDQLTLADGRYMLIARQIRALDADAPDQFNGQPVGILIALLPPEQFLAKTRRSRETTDSHTALIDGNRELIANTGTALPLTRFREQVTAGFEGTLTLKDANGDEFLISSRHVPLSGTQALTLLQYQRTSDVLGGLQSQLLNLGLVALSIGTVGLFLIWLAARGMSQPLRTLSANARLLGQGDLTVRTSENRLDTAETRDLAHAFNQMADAIERSTRELETRVSARTADLERERAHLHTLVSSIPDLVWLKDFNGVYLACNPTFERFFGASEAAIVGKTDHDFVDAALADFFRHKDQVAMAASGASVNEEWITFANDGHRALLETTKVAMRDPDGRVIGVLGIGHDITDRHEAEEKLRLFASVFTHAREGITITDRDAHIIEINGAFTDITGYSREEVLGHNPRMLKSDQQDAHFYADMWKRLLTHGHWSGEIWNRRKDGEAVAQLVTISAVRGEQGEIQNYIALFSDITPLKAQQALLEHIAHNDALTGLPNRLLLADRLKLAMHQASRRGQRLAVAYLDLDGFKSVNDAHSHEVGDRLLIALAQRMNEALRQGDTLARIGGDEFVAVLVDLPDDPSTLPVLQRLLQAAALPVHLGELTVQVSASIGVSVYPQDEEVDADQLVRQADQAMYEAKQSGKNRFHLFDAVQDRSARGRHESLTHLQQALVRNEFVLFFQPKVNMGSGELLGAEALIRWQHPERGLLPPAMFLPVIENHPFSIELGEWVIDTALSQIESWHAQGLSAPVSVNIGALQLQHPDFVPHLRDLLARHPGVRHGDLELEILETSALADFAAVSQVMTTCQALGVRFAVDDFGTGYSSLSYLKRLPEAALKIDQSFVRDMLDDPDDLAILKGVLGLAEAFNRPVIAEGVETPEHGEMLLRLGCHWGQGYAIARPMPAHELPLWLGTWTAPPNWKM